jgi:hypothetical protein
MGFGANGSAAAQVLDALRSASAQQQQFQFKQQQQSLMDQFNRELEMRKQGYTPYMTTTSVDSSGLKRRDAQQVEPGRVVSDPWGRKWVAPEAKPSTAPQQTFADSRALLEKGALPVSPNGTVHQDADIPRYQMDEQGNLHDTGMFGVNVPVPDQGRVVTPPGGKQSFYIPSEEEQSTLKTRLKRASENPHLFHTQDEDGTVHLFAADPSSGQAKETGTFKGAGRGAASKSYSFSYHTDDAGTVHVLRGDPESGEVSEVKAIKGAGPKRKDPDATPGEKALTAGQKQVQQRFNARELRSANTEKTTRLEKAEAEFAKDLQVAGGAPDKVQAAKDRLWRAKQVAQDEYEESLKALGVEVQHVDYGAQRQAMRGGGGRGSAPAAAAAPATGKVAGVDSVRGYAQRKGITEAQAVREFQDAGYTIGR